MTGILSRFTVTPLLWACGLQLVVIAVLGGLLYVQDARVDVANAASESASAWATTARTERDAWKGVAETLRGANLKWEEAFAKMQGLLAQAQGENRRLDAAGQSAIEAARNQAAAADRRLAEWKHKAAQQLQVRDCSDALEAVELRCPAMEGY